MSKLPRIRNSKGPCERCGHDDDFHDLGKFERRCFIYGCSCPAFQSYRIRHQELASRAASPGSTAP